MPAEREFGEVLDAYFEQEEMHRWEGRKGVENLCQLARAIGYKDPQHFGQLTRKATLGDLIDFLEDNSGAIEAIVEWVRDRDIPEWRELLEEELPPAEDEDDEEIEGRIRDDEERDEG